MHEYLHPADRLICSGIYWCGPKPIPKPLSEIVSPETEGLRVEWWLVEISQRCTRVLCLWWSGPGNYIRGTLRALELLSVSLSLTLCPTAHTSNASCVTPTLLPMQGCTLQTLTDQQSRTGTFVSSTFYIMPCMVRQTRVEDLWHDSPSTCTQHLSVESICSLLIGECDLGEVINWKWTNAGEILNGPSGS